VTYKGAANPVDPMDFADASARLDQIAPGYLDRVRSAASDLSLADREPSDVRAALMYVEDMARVDVDIPTASRRSVVRWLKGAVKRLVGWYLRYLGEQVTALGQAVGHLGTVLADRTDVLVETTAELQTKVNDLTARVDRLEAQDR
jgi:hypothetical protein